MKYMKATLHTNSIKDIQKPQHPQYNKLVKADIRPIRVLFCLRSLPVIVTKRCSCANIEFNFRVQLKSTI